MPRIGAEGGIEVTGVYRHQVHSDMNRPMALMIIHAERTNSTC
jgi:hypothetical protein